jgi:hypothetical protein
MTGIRTKGWRPPIWRLRGWGTATLAAAAVIVSSALVACSDHAVEPVAVSGSPVASVAKLGPLTAASAGAYHNAFLEFSFPRMRQAMSQGANHARGCRVIAQAMRDFVVLHRLPVHPSAIGDAIAGGRCAGRRSTASNASFWLADDGITTPEFDAVVAEMEYAVEAGLPQSDIASLFNQKVAYARTYFPAMDADVIEAAASVGFSSVQYWEANYETQYALLKLELEAAYSRLPDGALGPMSARSGPLHTPPQAPLFWRRAAARVGLADLKGAVHGGITGARGGWQGALAGAVIEGGARSAGALLDEVF